MFRLLKVQHYRRLVLLRACNFTLKHKFDHHINYILSIIIPEIGRNSSKVTKSSCDKIMNLYKK